MKLIDFIITVFVLVDDFYKRNIDPRQLRTRGFMPNLSDSEAITMEIVSEQFFQYSLATLFCFFKKKWPKYNRNLKSKKVIFVINILLLL